MKRGLIALSVILLALAAGPAAADIGVFAGSQDIGNPPWDPALAGSAGYDSGTGIYTVTGGGSDWWSDGECAHFAYKPITGDFRLEADVNFIATVGMSEWAKAGVAIRNNLNIGDPGMKQVNFLSAVTAPNRWTPAGTFQYRLNADWGMSDNTWWGAQPAKVAIQMNTVNVEGQSVPFVEGFLDYGSGWQRVNGLAALNLNSSFYAGLAVTAHDNGRLETAEFSNVAFVAPTAPQGVPAYLPWEPGKYVPGPAGGMGYFGVREVWNNGGVGNLGEAYERIRNVGGGAFVVDYQPGAINIHDSDWNGQFGNDATFGVVTAGYTGKGSVDNISMVAHGTVRIPVSDTYTFCVNSDDGFELKVGNQVVAVANYGKGASDVLGSRYMEAGDYRVQLLYWEGSGGASVELSAARGWKGGWDGDFRPIGYPAVKIPGLAGDVNIEATQPEAYWPGGRDQALQAILDGRAAGTNSTSTADRVNHSDPQNGGGTYGGDMDFPNNTDNDDNDFAFMATGTLRIPASGIWYIGFQSDDGDALQIAGQTWLEVVENWTGYAVIEGDWLKTDAWTGNSHTVGKIALAAGDYPFTLVGYEGGGGSYFELFGSDTLGIYELIVGGDGQAFPAGLELVPEPTTLVLLGLGAGLALWRRRRS